MSFTKFPTDFWNILKGPYEVTVMLRIMLRMTSDGSGVCYESRAKMAEACNIYYKTITEVIISLEQKNLIVVDRKHRRSHHITLHPNVKKLLEGVKHPLTRVNIDLDGGWNTPTKEDRKMENSESAKRPRKKRKPSAAVKKKRVIKYASDLDRIHETYLQSLKGKPEEGDGS